MNSSSYYELYRRSSVGMALTDALDDLISEGRIDPQLAMKILSNFDRSITEVLSDKVKANLSFKVVYSTLTLTSGCFFRGRPKAKSTYANPPQHGGIFRERKKGHLDTYRFCDEVWTFLIKNVQFKLQNSSIVHTDKVKIVSCNSKKPGEA